MKKLLNKLLRHSYRASPSYKKPGYAVWYVEALCLDRKYHGTRLLNMEVYAYETMWDATALMATRIN